MQIQLSPWVTWCWMLLLSSLNWWKTTSTFIVFIWCVCGVVCVYMCVTYIMISDLLHWQRFLFLSISLLSSSKSQGWNFSSFTIIWVVHTDYCARHCLFSTNRVDSALDLSYLGRYLFIMREDFRDYNEIVSKMTAGRNMGWAGIKSVFTVSEK